jgi:hypothetical protein
MFSTMRASLLSFVRAVVIVAAVFRANIWDMIASCNWSRLAFVAVLIVVPSGSQTPPPPPSPPPNRQNAPMVRGGYPGPQVRIPGIFMTPVANAPFSATVKILSHQPLPDGTEHVVTSVDHVARTSSGVIYNERRALVPVGFKDEPRLLGALIYDPNDRLSISLEPMSRLARERTLDHPPVATPGPTAPGPKIPGTVETDLGTQDMNGVELRGLRRERTIPANLSGTGKPITITDDYWYSPALSVYLIIRHDDPRTGEQMVAVTDIDRHEPNGALFVVPEGYKVVDETPPPPVTNAPGKAN